MTFAPASAINGVLASIPSPSVSYFDIGPLRIHFYALCIIAGIIVATLMTNHRLSKRGAEPWVVIDIALIAVPLAIICARIYHVLTHFSFYFGAGRNPWSALFIWEGGIAIYGALIGGAIGAWLGCRWTGIRFWSFADALAPGLIVAQAMGRLGNYFNHELFGLPTSLPWGLEIEATNPAFPAGLAPGTLFHPTFLYEMIWNLLGAAVLLWAGHRLRLQWGRLFGLYLIWYSAGRIVWESIRIDPSDVFLGLRTNVWAAIIGVILGLVIMIAQKKRHLGLEPSPYRPGREWSGPGAVQSGVTPEFVDVSDPVDDLDPAAAVTSEAVAGSARD
ncbi:prolipoprotein diacylglyceryl transferase [Microbacterium protaetiae]|uniref:Phosphatidylglycerol--prolipoprotein diacylglyceryl transferase n=1 Tax=Microbacterium protaetiae TaxID=2509458 RepID=A0A4P6EI51_9MICO|nr:prolipoprotein diacylglyceryl transferase [Microbacterium protaetiae]QAY61223.1 prolipoprotein diacylglyceryl transferase [Microbacterium protaetiae]